MSDRCKFKDLLRIMYQMVKSIFRILMLFVEIDRCFHGFTLCVLMELDWCFHRIISWLFCGVSGYFSICRLEVVAGCLLICFSDHRIKLKILH